MSEHRGLNYFSFDYGERNHGFLPTMATSIFAIESICSVGIMTIHRYWLMILITRRHLSVVIIDLATTGMVMAGCAIILHILQTTDLWKSFSLNSYRTEAYVARSSMNRL